MALSKSINKGQIPINCQLCETDKVIKWKCIECNLLMCNNCRDKIHPKFRNAKDHKIVDIKDVGHYNEELNFTNIKCDEHTEQFSCLFCKKCDSLVCPTCVSKVHKKHANDLIEISEAYELKIERIKNGQSNFNDTKASMTTRKDQLDQLKTAENSKLMKVRQDILNHKKSLKTKIDNYFQKLESELDRSSTRVIQSIEHDLSATIGSIQEVENKTDEVRDFINLTDATEFFQKIRKLEKFIKVHKAPTTKAHNSILKFIPGEITQSNVGKLQSVDIQFDDLSVDTGIYKTFQTDFTGVTYLSSCRNSDNILWIACGIDRLVKRVKPDGNKLKVLSSLNTNVYGMAILQSDDVLLSTGESTVQKLSVSNGKLTDTVYDVAPLVSTDIHITSSNQVVVGGNHDDLGRRAVFVMNEKGENQTVYEQDQHSQPIFTYPWSITSTTNGNIHVVDIYPDSDKGRVVVLGQRGKVINTYTGHTDMNKKKSFRPVGIVTTPRDNVIVADMNTHTLQILNNDGHLMTYHNTDNKGILCPVSLAFTPTGQLYIGCGKTNDSTTKEAKIYQVTITEC